MEKESELPYSTVYYRKNKERFRKYREKSKEKNKERQLKINHGITPEEQELMLVRCNGRCEICFVEVKKKDGMSQKSDYMCIDHCHNTGSIRGILCCRCNLALGGFKDSIDILKSAVKYLERSI